MVTRVRTARAELPRLVWRDGLHLEGTVLWFDAARRHHLSFVSHARVPLGRTGRVLATSATAALLGLDGRGGEPPLLLEVGRPLALGPLSIELVPSGYLLGAAQAVVETVRGRVLYAADLRLEPAPTTPPAQTRRADVLVLGSSLDRAALAAPAGEPPAEALAAAVERALARGEAPVVFARSPGSAQDLLALLRAFALRAHPQILAHTALYERLGVRLPRPPAFRGRLRRGEVLLWPSGVRAGRALGRLERPQRIETSLLYETAGPAALARFCEAVGAGRVLVKGACAEPLADFLRRRGQDARPLSPEQLGLFGE